MTARARVFIHENNTLLALMQLTIIPKTRKVYLTNVMLATTLPLYFCYRSIT